MTKKEKIIDLMKVFFSTEEVVEEKMEDVTTVSGIVLTILEDGSVMIGEEVAPDGEYVLEDQTILIVKDGKKIVEEVTDEPVDTEMSKEYKVVVKNGKKVVEDTQMSEVELEKEVEEVEKEVEEVEKELEEEDTRINELEKAVIALLEKVSEMESKMVGMGTEMSKFAKLPAEDEIKIEKTEMSSNKELSKLEIFKQLRNNNNK